MTGIDAVCLDAAGTLIRVRQPVGESYARIAARHGIPVEADEIAKAFRTVFPRMSPLAFGTLDPQSLDRQERDWWRTLVRSCLGRHGQHRGFAPFFDELFEYYRGASAWALYPEVEEVLDALEHAGIPVAVVSNFDRRLHAVLAALGIAERFRTVLCSTEAGAAKPDRRIFEQACRALGVPAESTLHAGDSRHADLEGARAAGLRALWVRRDERLVSEPDVIADLRGVLEHLAG